MPSYMSQGRRKGAVSKLLKGSGRGAWRFGRWGTFQVPQGPGRPAV